MKISNCVIDARKLEKDFSFCGTFCLDNVDLCVVKYILSGRGCMFNKPTGVTWNGVRRYMTANGGEMIYVTGMER